MNINEINNKLKEMLHEKRYKHSINVSKCAKNIAKVYNFDEEKAYLAGMVHDCAKNLNEKQVKDYISKYNIKLDKLEENNIDLSHGIIGSYIVKYEFNIKDEEIISSVKYHTTGNENMILLEKIIYMADLIEEDRNFEGVELLRELTYNKQLDKALLISYNNTINLIIDRNQLIHPKTIKARNYLIRESNYKL